MQIKRAGAAVAAAGLLALAGPAAASAGLNDASASPGSASASPLNLSGLLTLGKSNASSKGSNVEVLSVAGLNLLSKQGTSGAAQNAGALAPVGQVVDQLNAALCPNGPGNPGTCLVVLYSNASNHTTTTPLGTSDAHNAAYTTVAVNLGDTGLGVLGSEAASQQATSSTGATACQDGARSYLVATKGTTVPPSATQGLQNVATSSHC